MENLGSVKGFLEMVVEEAMLTELLQVLLSPQVVLGFVILKLAKAFNKEIKECLTRKAPKDKPDPTHDKKE
jgi:thiamine transporter ThiT